MSSSEINALKRKLKFSYVAISILVAISIGFFFYGLTNNIQAMKDKEAELTSRVQLKECESKSQVLMDQASVAQHEAERQKALAELAFARATEGK